MMLCVQPLTGKLLSVEQRRFFVVVVLRDPCIKRAPVEVPPSRMEGYLGRAAHILQPSDIYIGCHHNQTPNETKNGTSDKCYSYFECLLLKLHCCALLVLLCCNEGDQKR